MVLRNPPRSNEMLEYPYVMTSLALNYFQTDHPDVDRNVFVAMRLDPSPLRTRIHDLIRSSIEDRGLHAIRADDRDYSGELWTNVKLCLDHSSLAVAVFDDDDRHVDNLAVELGYLFARDVPCLILRESRLGPPVAMLAHRLHTSFDALDLEGSLLPAVTRWLDTQRNRTVA